MEALISGQIVYQVVFYVFGGITLISALGVVASQNILRSAFSLLFTLFGVAGLYVLLSADFLAATQVLLYVGGILILILFAVMLTQRIGELRVTNESRSVATGVLAAGALVVILFAAVFKTSWKVVSPAEAAPTTAQVGNLLLTDYLLPFEIVSVLLLAALIGAVVLARKEEGKE